MFDKLTGTILASGWVMCDTTGRLFQLDWRGTDSEGYPEVLIDASKVGGDYSFKKQSIKPYIGMKCTFTINTMYPKAFNFKIIK